MLISMEESPPAEPVVAELVKKFATFHRTLPFIIVFETYTLLNSDLVLEF